MTHVCDKLPKLQSTEFKGVVHMKTSLVYPFFNVLGVPQAHSLPWTCSKLSDCHTGHDKRVIPATQEVQLEGSQFQGPLGETQ